MFARLSLLVALLSAFSTTLSLASVVDDALGLPQCKTAVLPLHVNAQNVDFNLDPPKDQAALTGFVTRLTSQASNVTDEIVRGSAQVGGTYDVWTRLCVPPGFKEGGTLQFTVHGINFDHSYWNFGDSLFQGKYNYAQSALQAGYAVFLYDRLGVGRSSKPHGIKEVQQALEVEIARTLVQRLRNGDFGNKFGQIVGIGHSYGSIQLTSLVSRYADVLDAVILTGFTSYNGGSSTAVASLGLTIAAQQNKGRFRGLTNSYVAVGTPSNNEQTFFRYPSYEPAVFQLAEATKQTATLGELLTQAPMLATQYSGPLYIVTGENDYIFCGGNCYQSSQNHPDLVAASVELFPKVTDFSYYIPPETGHAVNMHNRTPDTYSKILKWLADRNI